MNQLNAKRPGTQETLATDAQRAQRGERKTAFFFPSVCSVPLWPMVWSSFPLRLGALALIAVTTIALNAAAPPKTVVDDAIEGVQVAALDQPRVYMEVYRTANGKPLMTKGEGATSAIEAFLDTGASGVVLSTDTSGKLGIKDDKTRDGKPIVFEDTGVAGSEKFGVTEPLFAALAPYPNGEQPGDFAKPMGPIRMQTRPEAGI